MVVRLPMTDPAEVVGLLWSGFGHYELGFDVGANCGQSVGHLLKLCDRVVSVEPNADAFEALAYQWGPMYRSVSCVNAAVTDHMGTVQLAQLPGKQAETGQLVTPGLAGMEWDPGDWADVPMVACLALTLDHLAGDHGWPGFVKVDVEGHESRVLAGAEQVLDRRATDWLIEFHSPQNLAACTDLLTGAGCSVQLIRHPHYAENSPMWHQHGWIKAISPRKGAQP